MAAASCPASCGQRSSHAQPPLPHRVPALPPCRARPLRPPAALPSGAPSPPSTWPLPCLKGPSPPRDTVQLPALPTPRPPESPGTSAVPWRWSPWLLVRGRTHSRFHVSRVVPSAAVAPWTCRIGKAPSRRGRVCGSQAKCLGTSLTQAARQDSLVLPTGRPPGAEPPGPGWRRDAGCFLSGSGRGRT